MARHWPRSFTSLCPFRCKFLEGHQYNVLIGRHYPPSSPSSLLYHRLFLPLNVMTVSSAGGPSLDGAVPIRYPDVSLPLIMFILFKPNRRSATIFLLGYLRNISLDPSLLFCLLVSIYGDLSLLCEDSLHPRYVPTSRICLFQAGYGQRLLPRSC